MPSLHRGRDEANSINSRSGHVPTEKDADAEDDGEADAMLMPQTLGL